MQKANQPELNEKVKEVLRRNAEAREREAKTVRLDIGQKRPYLFDLEKVLQPEPKKRDDGSEYLVVPYIVEDERFPGYEKIFYASSQLSERLMVEKVKGGEHGRYNVYPL
jgi:hypothetical protein